jgi:hypothetical protein
VLTSIISSVAMPVLPATGMFRRQGRAISAFRSERTCAATQSSSAIEDDHVRWPQITDAVFGAITFDTVAVATCWK